MECILSGAVFRSFQPLLVSFGLAHLFMSNGGLAYYRSALEIAVRWKMLSRFKKLHVLSFLELERYRTSEAGKQISGKSSEAMRRQVFIDLIMEKLFSYFFRHTRVET